MLLLSTSTLWWYGLHRIFDFASKAWYDGIDISLHVAELDLWDADYILSLIKLYHIPVKSLTAPWKDMGMKKFQDIFDLGKKIWVNSISFAPPHIMDKDTKWFHHLAKIQKTTDIFLCVRNVESTFLFFVIPEYSNASFEKIKSTTGNVSLDILAVQNSSQMDIMRALAVLWSSLKNIYLADKRDRTLWTIPWTWAWGLSNIPLESFFMKLKAQSYKGDISLRVNPKEIWVWNPELVLKHLNAMKFYYTQHFK